MRKKLSSLMLGMVVGLSVFSFTFAAETEESVLLPETEAYQTVEQKEQPEAGSSEMSPEPSFSDVQDTSSYYYHPVHWAVKKGITVGIDENLFMPEELCTRGQMVTFLWRMAGMPAADSADNPFIDVTEEAYYRDAVLWTVEQGITQGTEEGVFSPEMTCTRAQCVTFLWRYHDSPDDEARSDFDDVEPAAYYAPAVFWALKNGVANGTSVTAFSPEQKCTRAQTVSFFYRSMKQRVEKADLINQEIPADVLMNVQTDGQTGAFTLQASGVAVLSGLREVQAAVWTKEDRSDIRWFTLDNAAELDHNLYCTTQNVASFHRSFGNYHTSLFLTRAADENVQLIHAADLDFEIVPDSYLFAEDLGMGRIRAGIQGVPPGITDVEITFRTQDKDPDESNVLQALRHEDGAWIVEIDWLSFTEGGQCFLEASDAASGDVLRTLGIDIPKVKKVIDVSQYQGNINWTAAKDSGVFEAVLMRCGLRNYRGKCVRDTKFTSNAQACQNRGIPFGCYWFTSALTVKEAYEEADYCAALLEPYHLEYPVFLDTEWGSRSGLNRLEKGKRTDCVKAFLERMKSYGYQTGIYAASDWYWGYMNTEDVASERIWVASWKGRPFYPQQYMGWQYTEKARIPGITQNTVDVSYWFE